MGCVENEKDVLCLSGPAVMELIQAVHEKGAAFRFKATGYSMTPSIRNNDVITISPLKKIPPSVGEVVAFRHLQTGRLMIHRVVRKKQGSFFIKGDRLRQMDGNIPLENILGVITRVERGGQTVFWPDRFRHPLWTKLYFKGLLSWLNVRRGLKAVRRRIVRALKN
ncbi:MAG: S24/S26 family peptidase [Candidatus Aminicenantes bacterium]|nr:MAG: S24/S26 family peptidase [Candidatus Aminicenantes bacterium]